MKIPSFAVSAGPLSVTHLPSSSHRACTVLSKTLGNPKAHHLRMNSFK